MDCTSGTLARTCTRSELLAASEEAASTVNAHRADGYAVPTGLGRSERQSAIMPLWIQWTTIIASKSRWWRHVLLSHRASNGLRTIMTLHFLPLGIDPYEAAVDDAIA